MAMAKNKTICIDFDGVLAEWPEGEMKPDNFGEMIPNADNGTSILKKKGFTVIIYTTRPVTDALKAWLKEHKIEYDYINENPDQPKDAPIEQGCKIKADIYLDDRGICFRGHWDWIMREIAEFSPWIKEKKDEKKEMEYQFDEGDIWKRGHEKRIKAGKHCDNAVCIG